MQVETTVDESDIGRVSVGQEATFTVDAYTDDNFSGTVSQIRLAPQVVQNVVNYTVIISVENKDLKLMPGMTANVKILVGKKSNVLKISNLALRFQPPVELVDSTALKGMRDSFKSRFKGKGNSNQQSLAGSNPGTNSNSKLSGKNNYTENNQSGSKPGSYSKPDGNRFKAIRDSIIKSHGGKMSKNEMLAEFTKAYSKYKQKNQQQTKTGYQKPQKNSSTNKYEIVSSYPQYEKSSYEPYDKFGLGRIWVLNKNGKLQPLFVRTGLNDGRSTEIISDKLNEGEDIVIGADANSNDQSSQTSNPLTGQQQRQGPGGGRMIMR